MKTRALLLIVLLAFCSSSRSSEPSGPQPLPKDAPKLKKDVVVVVAGSSISMNKYRCAALPAWTGGSGRVPPQANGQNVFFRIFEMLNDHENMRWRRLTDKDWKRGGAWRAETKLAYNGACYGKRISYEATRPEEWADLSIPAGYEKVELIYTSDPKGDEIKVTIDGKAPAKNAVVDTYQETRIPADAKLAAEIDTLDSHGKPRKLKRPKKGISNIVGLRARYEIDKAKAHTLRVQRAGKEAGKRILIWGAVYWRGNCVQVIQRAKGGLNCGDLPRYAAIQEVLAVKPDYVLMEGINIRSKPSGVTRSLGPGYAWCAARKKRFKTLVYSTCQASSGEFRKWFRVPANKPPYGAKDYGATCSDENCNACHKAVVDLCRQYGFPLVDVGGRVDAYMAKTPSIKFVPHILNDWYHPNQWGAALFGRTIHDGIRKHWPELPIRPVNMPVPPKGK